MSASAPKAPPPRYRRLKLLAVILVAIVASPFVLIAMFARASESGR